MVKFSTVKTFHSITGNCIESVRARGIAVLDKGKFEDGMGIKIATLIKNRTLQKNNHESHCLLRRKSTGGDLCGHTFISLLTRF